MATPTSFLEKHKDCVLKLRLVGIGGTPQIRRVRLPRVAVEGSLSYDALVGVAIGYTFPDAPLVLDDYDVIFTYYDVDNDCVTIASTEELKDAIGQFGDVLRITTDVKRKKNRPIPATPPPRVSRAAEEAPGTPPPPSPPFNRTAQLQSILETFVSILATAVVALQSHVNPAPSVTNPPATATSVAIPPATAPSEARVTMDAPTVPEADHEAAKERHLNKKRDIQNLKKEIRKLKRDSGIVDKDATEPAEKPVAVECEFIHGRHTCDRCLCTPIVGKRFHATNLPDYDLCEKCKDGYKGTEIQFEAVELDRDRPFQERWHRKRARFAAAGHCSPRGGPRGAKRSPYCGGRGRRGGPMGAGRPCHGHPEPMDFALKEAIRRSLQDANKAAAPEPSAPVDEVPTPAPVEETKPATEETKPAASIEKPETAAPVTFEVNLEEPMSNASFSLDAVGNGTVAEVLGHTLDQCADAIDAMVMEINRAYSTHDTVTSTDAEVKQTDDESTIALSVADSIEEEAEIVVETVTEDDNDAGNKPDSVAEATEDSPMAGATILEPVDPEGVMCEEESVKSERSEDEWEVVRDDDQGADDEMLARAASVIGSSLFESDMAHSNASTLTEGADSSVLSSVPTIASVSVPAVLLDRWAPQLTQLRELGFVDNAQLVDILERLSAANIGVESDDEITVERVINILLKND